MENKVSLLRYVIYANISLVIVPVLHLIFAITLNIQWTICQKLSMEKWHVDVIKIKWLD